MSLARSALATAPAPIIISGITEDGALYPIEKLEAHRRGVLHEAVSVFVMQGDRLLLQRRAAGKYHSGGMWANTCCSHPGWGEAPIDAAQRRLREELGLSLPLRPCKIIEYEADVGSGLTERERVHVFVANVAEDVAIALKPDPAEVSATAWMAVSEAQNAARCAPERYAPWFRIYLVRWDELGL